MSAHSLPINDILIYYCNQELDEAIDGRPAALREGKHRLLHRFEDRRYISGKLRRLQRVDRQVEWGKVVAAIYKDRIINYPDFSTTCCGEGSLRDFNIVFESCYDTMYVFAYNLIWASTGAKEMATESFVRFWRSYTDFESPAAVKPYLYKATRDCCLDYLQLLRKDGAIEPDILTFLNKSLQNEEFLKEQIINAEIFSELLREMDSLPVKCRDVVRLTYFQSLSAGEVAGQLQTSYREVLHQKARGVRIMRTSFLKKALLPPQEYFYSLV